MTLDELMIHCGVREFSERSYSFESYPWKDEHLQRMMRWAEGRSCNVLITGNIGVGKSGLAIGAMKERLKRGDSVWFEGREKSILLDPYRAKKLNLDLIVLDDVIQFWNRGKENGLLELLNQGVKFIATTTQWNELSLSTLGAGVRGRIEKFEHIVLERGES